MINIISEIIDKDLLTRTKAQRIIDLFDEIIGDDYQKEHFRRNKMNPNKDFIEGYESMKVTLIVFLAEAHN